MNWNSNQYLKFEQERTQPSIDLVNRISIEPKSVIDIGCGPGNSTEQIRRRFPNADILGADNSQNMIDKARENYPELEFAICDAENDLPNLGKKYDLVFSNACIQWIPNHKKLIPEMMSILNDGGMLAVQIPMQSENTMHKIMNRVAMRQKWAEKLNFKREFYILTAEEYFDILSDCSSGFEIWETHYCHRLSTHEDLIEWYRGTGLRPYIQKLNAEDGAEFERDVLAEALKEYPMQKNGEILFKFPRLFFIAKK